MGTVQFSQKLPTWMSMDLLSPHEEQHSRRYRHLVGPLQGDCPCREQRDAEEQSHARRVADAHDRRVRAAVDTHAHQHTRRDAEEFLRVRGEPSFEKTVIM